MAWLDVMCVSLSFSSPAFEFMQLCLVGQGMLWLQQNEKLAVDCAHSASGLHHFNLVLSLPDKKGSPTSESKPSPLCKG